MNVSRETIEKISYYVSELIKWNKAINLVASSTVTDIQNRHIEDSLQLLEICTKPIDNAIWLDIGSGGGLPIIPISISFLAFRPDIKFYSIESDQRKAVFLKKISRELELNLEVIAERVEGVSSLNADIISARGLASLTKLCEMSSLHARDLNKIELLFLKGKNWKMELTEAERMWLMGVETFISKTDSIARVVKIKGLVRKT